MLTLTLIIKAPTRSGKTIPSGTVVKYLGHVPGGMVQVEYEGQQEIIHPGTTKELS